MFKTLTTAALALTLLAGCSGQVESAADKAAAKAGDVAEKTAAAAGKMTEAVAGPDITTLPAGLYESDSGHAYIAFSYNHAGYSKPILRWGSFGSTVMLNTEDPEKSGVGVTIDTASVDSGVKVWDEKLVGEDWFDAKNFPVISFQSTDVNQSLLGNGTLTGNLTIKGVEKPITLDVKLNKVGEHFRSKKPMFGISATGKLKRSDFGIDKYAPMADEVDLMVEVEFIKADGQPAP